MVRLEQQLAYRVRAYIAASPQRESEFTLSGLRIWMLSQSWPWAGRSAWLECLAVLSWSAICAIDAEPEREVVIQGELERQLDFLDGANVRRPSSLDAFRSDETRVEVYTALRAAAEPGSARRQSLGLPRFNAGTTRP